VKLLGRVLFVLDGLMVDLNVVRVSLQFSLSLYFFDGVRVVRLGRHLAKVLDTLRHLALGEIRVAKVLSVRVSHGTIGSSHLFRSSSACGGIRGNFVVAASASSYTSTTGG
jgi:hypothetical protein